MRLIIEARLVDGETDTFEECDGVLAVVVRPDRSLAELGLTLAEGRSLLAKVQTELISKQVQRWLSGQTRCQNCGAALSHKDSRSTVLCTVYGKVPVKSPQLWSCACQGAAQTPQRVVHPLSRTLTRRVTPELEYLQAKWAVHLPYRQAAVMLKEVLPLGKGTSSSGIRDRILDLGKQLDAEIERDIARLPQSVADEQIPECSHVAMSPPWASTRRGRAIATPGETVVAT
ncbi:hypothetical protein PQR57_43355 [Paraburkholderia dipogonis]|uniref:Uncharacterized protein n=1 Tax=Paraburkholderia dipogonis TaxID=1211383 RepID=A0ABW9B6C8_9BURK